jgi:hypothetical protein
MAATFTAACDALAALLEPLSGVTVYNYTPNVGVPGPMASIDDDNANSTVSSWFVPVNVYMPASLPSTDDAQAVRRALIDSFEAVFDAEGIPATWVNGRLQEFDTLITSWTVELFMDPL